MHLSLSDVYLALSTVSHARILTLMVLYAYTEFAKNVHQISIIFIRLLEKRVGGVLSHVRLLCLGQGRS